MKKVLIAALAVGITAAGILLSVPKTQAAGTSPVVMHLSSPPATLVLVRQILLAVM